jgi:lipid A ethanolaminephosphotransferase
MQESALFPRQGWSVNTLIVAVTAFLLLAGNRTFVSRVLDTYPPTADNLAQLLSLVPVFGAIAVILLAPFCFRRSTRPLLATVLMLSAAASYFMDTYGVIISDDMLRNVAHTNIAEAGDLVTIRLFVYLTLLGVLPAWFVAAVPLRWQSFGGELRARAKLVGIAIALVAAMLFAFSSFYASFFRVHKELRQHANPVYYLYSVLRFAGQSLRSSDAGVLQLVGTDAAIPASDVTRDLVILVVGETARADRFSINGYPRETTPLLAKQNIVSFTNFWACGTSTAVSVPCMFLLNGETRGHGKIATEENLLDVLQHGGVHVLWRDNNSDSKGVAGRVPYQDFKTPATNPVCNPECRDEGMLAGLQEYIDAHPSGDILIVLHQMGSHGPAYSRRYPQAFEKFKPACRDSDLSRCTREEIGNAYDNTILYTDHFLNQAIELLKRNDTRFETALFYVSDHGESLGENGLYLHGLPKAIAPDTQLQVPALMWFGRNFRLSDPAGIRRKSAQHYSHNNVFHTLLGFFEIETSVYDAAQDMLHPARPK